MIFEWDENKNDANIRKHGISFQLASSVFSDPNRMEYWDETHSSLFEDRYITIGRIADTVIIVVVVYADRAGTIRIISARCASKKEEREYYVDSQNNA